MKIVINDLKKNTELEQIAMGNLSGGWKNTRQCVAYTNHSATGWNCWMDSGAPFSSKKYRDRLRTKVIKIKQRKRDWQFKAEVKFSM